MPFPTPPHNNTDPDPPEPPVFLTREKVVDDELLIEELCDAAADRAGVIRGALLPHSEWSVSYDPTLGCGVAYFQLDDPSVFEAYLDEVVAALDWRMAPPLANGIAPSAPGEPSAFCVLFEMPPDGPAPVASGISWVVLKRKDERTPG